MQNSTKFYIKKLSSKFYEDYPQKIYEEILSKKDRPYTCLMIQNRGYWISVPFRTEIHHEYAYHFKMSERSKKHHSGLDYTKCVIITKTEYISEESPVIDQDEYRELVRNIGKVIDSVIQFIDEYVADRKGNKKLHTKEFERRYAFSTLRYFHGELGLEEKKYKNLKQEEIPMLRDKVRKYYLEQDYNCAETILRCIDEEYQLGLEEADFHLVSAFGGGMGCGSSCGALCGAMAALGRLVVKMRAHATEGFKETCADYVKRFEEKLGSTECLELVKQYKKEDIRCMETVCLAADVFEEFFLTHGLEKRISS